MRLLVALILIVACSLSHAEDERGTGGFLGIGLQTGSGSMSVPSAGAPSKFSNQGYLLEGGGTVGNFSGVQVSGEAGSTSSINTSTSQSYLETGKLNYFGTKVGMFVGNFTLGGGYRHNSMVVRSISIQPSAYRESTYEGYTPLGFANLSLDRKDRYRATIEGQYVTGTLKNSAGLSDAKFNEMSLSLRFFLLFK